MLFVKTEDLKPGMRLAKPIYNRNGVMLYERNSKITSQGIISVNNFGLIGIYILEPAEPVPPMSEDDIEFERFQAMSIFEIKEILDAYSEGKKENNMYQFINQLLKIGDEPLSEIAAIRYLLEMEDQFDRKIVDALLDSINILSPGVCVEFTNGDKGLVVTANDSNVLEPFVLSFKDNKLYNLADSKVAEQMKIKDIMKTMDNRHVVDKEFLSQYMGKTLHMGEK